MIFDPILDIFRGKAVTIPPLDGAFRPNTKLDEAEVFASLSEPDNIAVHRGRLTVSSGNALFQIAAGQDPIVIETFPSPVTAIAVSPAGELAVGLETGKLIVEEKEVGLPNEIGCITALAYADDGTLWLTNGSADHSPSAWSADLMQKGRSGSLWKRETGDRQFSRVAGRLAYPYGLYPTTGGVFVSESWAHRLLHFDRAGGNRRTVLDHMPGYPARMSRARDGSVWLTLFAPRNRLIEFVLQESHYRIDMMSEVPQQYWIAPALASNRSFLEPLQCGGIKTMGIHKPWSPSRSYGLVVRLDAEMRPIHSFHSRANANRHGICSVLEHEDSLYVASKGGNCILALDPALEEVRA